MSTREPRPARAASSASRRVACSRSRPTSNGAAGMAAGRPVGSAIGGLAAWQINIGAAEYSMGGRQTARSIVAAAAEQARERLAEDYSEFHDGTSAGKAGGQR